jgi:single-stranded DNA-binding protein
MSLSVLCQGSLAGDPQSRTSAAGKLYCTALLRVPLDGEESMLTSLIAFESAAVKALMQLHKGDPVSVAGMGKLTSWTGKEGQERRGISITVQSVLSIYQARKRKREAPAQQDEETPA